MKVGPDTVDLNELLHVWIDIKENESYYKYLRAASKEKTEEAARLKSEKVLRKKQMLKDRFRQAPIEELQASTAAYEAAKQRWEELDRNTSGKGMYELFNADESSEVLQS